MKRRKFTDWINDPNDERIFAIPSRVPGLPPRRFKVDEKTGSITMMPYPDIFLLPADMITR